MGLTSNKYQAKFPKQITDVFGTMKTSNQSVGVSAAALPATALLHRRAIIIQNAHASQKLYISHTSTIDSSSGFRLEPGDTLTIPIIEDFVVYAISNVTDTDVRIIEFA